MGPMTVTVPSSLADALDALAQDPTLFVLAGGTDVMVQVNDGVREPGPVLALGAVRELRSVRREADDVVLGAALTYTDLMGEAVASTVPALAHAARTVGSPQIRNAGTLGGNLATASPAGDTLPVLVALGAGVEVSSATGTRVVPILDFLTGPKTTSLAPGELVVAVRVPVHRGPQEYLKVGVRNAMVISVASLALVVDLDRRSLGIGLGSVGPTALDAPEACAWGANAFEWHEDRVVVPALDVGEAFAARVAGAARPIDDHRGLASYRRHAIGVMARRALRRCSA
jgi:CO/xanthine dehydrogenase FAD-binding subunit